MNVLTGRISDIQLCHDLSLVSIECSSLTLKSIIIETPDTAPYLKIGNSIDVVFKETELIISKKGEQLISLQNRFPSTIIKMNIGELLSSISLQFEEYELNSIITTNAVKTLGLEEGMEVVAMVKTNEMMLAEK
jgi:molybdate transport system regulatory protein